MAVFLSYAHDDVGTATVLREELEKLADPVWMDGALTGGQDWWDEICAQIRGCDLFVLALSDSSVGSDACSAETEYAVALRRPFVAVRVADVTLAAAPAHIRRTQVIEFTAPTVDSVRALAKAVLRVRPSTPLPDPLPDPPPIPHSYEERFPEIFAPSMTLPQQVTAVALLALDIENDVNAREARELLLRLYHRKDLTKAAGKQIEALLGLGPPPAPPDEQKPDVAPVDPPPVDPTPQRTNDGAARHGTGDPANGSVSGTTTSSKVDDPGPPVKPPIPRKDGWSRVWLLVPIALVVALVVAVVVWLSRPEPAATVTAQVRMAADDGYDFYANGELERSSWMTAETRKCRWRRGRTSSLSGSPPTTRARGGWSPSWMGK